MMENKTMMEFDHEFNHMTELRFVELEIANFISQLKTKYGPSKGKKMAVNLFNMVSELDIADIVESVEVLDRHIMLPSKKENIIYLIFYKGLSQYKVKKIANNSPNFIAEVRKEYMANPYQLNPYALDHTVRLREPYQEISNFMMLNEKINFMP